MTELELYRKMYATVVYEADLILQDLPKALADPNCGRDELLKFGGSLKQVLLDAEEIYMSAEDMEDPDDPENQLVEEDCSQLLADYKKADYDAMYAETIATSEVFMRQLDERVKEKMKEDMEKNKKDQEA